MFKAIFSTNTKKILPNYPIPIYGYIKAYTYNVVLDRASLDSAVAPNIDTEVTTFETTMFAVPFL